MSILFISVALNTLLLLFTFYWMKNKSFIASSNIVAKLSEVSATVVLAVFSLILSYFLIVAKYLDITVAGTGTMSYLFIGGLSIICALLGCFLMLFTYLKKYILLKDRLIVVDFMGNHSDIYWKDIKSISIPMLTTNIKLKTKQNSYVIHSGEKKQYRNFVSNLKNLIPIGSGVGVLNDLYNRI